MRHFVFIGILLWACSRNALAAQGVTYGGPVGGTDIQSAYLPPYPGLYGSAIAVGALGEKFYDNAGQSSTTSGRLPGGIAQFGLLYVYPHKLFGGTLGSSVSTGYGWGSITVNGKHQNFEGMNDIYTDVLMWSKHLGTVEAGRPRGLTMKLGYSMVLPTGKYDAKELYTTGRNTLYHIPNGAFTYLTGPNFLGDGTEFSMSYFLDIARKNSATGYRNGMVVDVDMAISEVIGRWQLGVAGYYARQIADDRLNGQRVSGNRFASAAVGPVIAYNMPDCKCSVKFKAQFSVFTRNSLAPNAAYLFFNKAFN
ncbi:hypothetical protein GCM10008164_35510 [Achromobacter xylosoxidans]|nr:hypothetical protein GCM10008164_35510 [Achromobacter xylosoxidans]